MIHGSIRQRLGFSIFLFLFLLYAFSFLSSVFPTHETLPLHGYLQEKAIWCRGSSPKRASCLGMKVSAHPGEYVIGCNQEKTTPSCSQCIGYHVHVISIIFERKDCITPTWFVYSYYHGTQHMKQKTQCKLSHFIVTFGNEEGNARHKQLYRYMAQYLKVCAKSVVSCVNEAT